MKLKQLRLAALATVLVAGTASAQKTVVTGTGDGGSQHVTSTWTISGATISIAYGRPTLKGRSESQMMPVGSPWRTGADVATIITTDKPLTFGSTTLAAGRYTINTEPGDKEWHLILGKLGTPDQWGVPYLPNLEIGRVAMKLDHAAQAVEQLTITIDPGQTPSVHVAWGRTLASVAFRVGS